MKNFMDSPKDTRQGDDSDGSDDRDTWRRTLRKMLAPTLDLRLA